MKKFIALGLAIITLLMVAIFIHQRIQYNNWCKDREIIEYRVKWGDTLDGISYEHKPSWMDVREYCYYITDLNDMDCSNIYEGQTIKLYTTIGE